MPFFGCVIVFFLGPVPCEIVHVSSNTETGFVGDRSFVWLTNNNECSSYVKFVFCRVGHAQPGCGADPARFCPPPLHRPPGDRPAQPVQEHLRQGVPGRQHPQEDRPHRRGQGQRGISCRRPNKFEHVLTTFLFVCRLTRRG